MMMYLCEESPLKPVPDELVSRREPVQPVTPDWGSDPMEILMAKQEAERASAARYKSNL